MKTEKYECYHQPNIIQIGNLLDDLHGVHVHLFLLQRRYYRIYGKYASFGRICSHITKLKQRTKPQWKQLPSQGIQQVAKRIHLGYEKFFDYLADKKKGLSPRKVGKPQIKPQHKYNSLTFTQAGYEIKDNRIHIKCIDQSFTFWKHREWTGTIKTITIKRDNVGDYYLYLVCEGSEPTKKLSLTGHEAGADFGMKTFLTLSDGIKIESPDAKMTMTAWMGRNVRVLSLMDGGHVVNTVNIGCGVDRHTLIIFSVCGSFYCHTLPYAEFIRYPEKFRRNTDETHIHLLHA